MSGAGRPAEPWPDLAYPAWRDTCRTLHMWAQIVGKVRLALSPWTNHSWHSTLYVTARGLGTSLIPLPRAGFELEFDFLRHVLQLTISDGRSGAVELRPRTVAAFYRETMSLLGSFGIQPHFSKLPNEVAEAVPFDRDETHRSYDGDAVQRFWRALVQMDRVFRQFRSEFCGKCSPVHFFWGSFDLAVSRFSGRPAPPHPGGIPRLPDAITREAYSHEVSSLGFWPGADVMPTPVFYSYIYPEPEGFREATVRPEGATYHAQMKEFMLPYDVVRSAPDPDAILLEFAHSTYDAASKLAGWDREALTEKKPVSREVASRR